MRFPLEWGRLEPRPGALRLGLPDRLYCSERAAGLRPVLELVTTPGWAADSSTPCSQPCLSPPAEDHYGDLTRFAELVAARYPQAAAVEAWNEPNLHQFFTHPDPERYTALLHAIYVGVKDGKPRMPVLGGSLSNAQADNAVSGDISAVNFLERMYAAGAGDSMDAVSIHPYPIYALMDPRELFDTSLAAIQSVVDSHDEPGARHIWITEVGVSTAVGSGGLSAVFSPAGAASTLAEIYRRSGLHSDVDAVLFHTLVEPNAAFASPPGFGWVTPDPAGGFDPTPVYCQFAASSGHPIPCLGPLAPR